MRMNWRVAALIGLSVFATAACGHGRPERGHAQGPGGPRGGGPGMARMAGGIAPGDMFLFVSFDRDGNYEVTFDEVTNGVSRVFNLVDTDGNGIIAAAEWSVWSKKALGDAYASPYFMHMDRNQNGSLTEDEFLEAIYGRARQFDTDKDNILSYAELRPQVMPAQGMMGGGSGRPQGGGRGRGRPPGGSGGTGRGGPGGGRY